jgi:ribose transport system substrate-binding protein
MMRLYTAVILAALALAGCDAGSSASGKKKYRFALIPKTLTNEVFNYGKTAAEATAKEIAAKENVDVEILWQAPTAADPAKQASILQNLADQKVSGISVSVEEANTLKGAIDYAVDMGIPVMTFDSDSSASKRKAFFGTNDLECGEKLAHHLGKLLGGKGKVMVQSGSEAPNLQDRVKGVRDCFVAHYPGMSVIDVVKCNDDQKKAVEQIAQYTQSNKEIQGWVLVGGWAVFGDHGLDTIDPAKVKVVSCDAVPQTWQYLENGKCQMLLAQDLWGWGAQSVRILKDLADGKTVATGPGGRVNGALEEVTKENLDAFKKTWGERYGVK